MKRKIVIPATVTGIVLLLGIVSLLFYQRILADPAPLPTSLDVRGNNLATLGPIQVPGGVFTIQFDYTPLNRNGSVIMTTSDGQMLNYKNDPSGNSGSLVLPENYSGPVKILVYGSSWHLTAR